MVINLKGLEKKIVFLLSLVVLSSLLGAKIIQMFLAYDCAAHALGIEGYQRATAWDPMNSEHHYYLGRLLHYTVDSRDRSPAIASYNRALHLNPLVAAYWLDLGKAYEDSKLGVDAEYAFSMAVRLGARTPQVRWEAANFWLRQGNLDAAFANLKAAAEADTLKLNAAIHISARVTADSERILREVVPDTLPANLSFLNFSLTRKNYTAAAKAWARILQNEDSSFQVHDIFNYFDTLIHDEQIAQAVRVWNQAITKCGFPDRAVKPFSGPDMVQNGSFEKELINGGLDWHAPGAAGFSSAVDVRERLEGYRSWRIDFNGKENIDFTHLFQIIPLVDEASSPKSSPPSRRVAQGHAPGYQLISFTRPADRVASAGPSRSAAKWRKLVFSYYIRTQDLSTDQGVFWEIISFPKPGGLHIKSPMYSGTNPWSEGHIEFSVDERIPSVMVRLRRLPSQKLDNLLKGIVWVDGVKLVEAK